MKSYIQMAFVLVSVYVWQLKKVVFSFHHSSRLHTITLYPGYSKKYTITFLAGKSAYSNKLFVLYNIRFYSRKLEDE